MIEHIVKNNESLNDILDAYHISIDELKENNKHLTNFMNLACGTKLKIPYLKEEVEQILDETEVFVEKYYDNVIDSFEKKEEAIETKNEAINQEDITSNVNEQVPNSNEKAPNTRKINTNPFYIPYPGIKPPRMPYNGNNFFKK